MEGAGVSMRKGEEGQSGLEIVVRRDMPNHESPLRPPPTSDAAAESENLSGNGSSRSFPKREILVRLFARSLDVLLTILLVILFLPPYLLFLATCAFFGFNLLDDRDERGKKPGRKKGIFEKVGDPAVRKKEFLDPAVRLANWVSIIRNRVLVVILLWMIINLSIAGLRKKNVLGSKLWKWTLLIVILSCGYHAIGMVIHLCLYFLELICKDKKDEKDDPRGFDMVKKEVVYYAKGLRRSINLVIFSCSILLIWQFYFRSDHGLKQTSGSDKVFDLGTRTLISLLIFALLWLLKSILLLKWDAHVVYERFLDRILRAGFQVYFLALMSGKSWVIFRPEGNRSSEETQEEGDTNDDNNNIVSREGKTLERNKTENQRKTKESQESHEEDEERAEDVRPIGDQQKQEEVQKKAKGILHVEEQEHMLSKNVSTYAIQQMAKYFVALKVSSRKGGDATTGIFAKFELDDEEMKPLYEQLQEGVSLEWFEVWLRDRDRDYVTKRFLNMSRPLKLHRQVQSKGEVSYEKFKDWVVHATIPLDDDYVTKKDLRHRFKLDDKDTELLYKQLQDGKNDVSYKMFKDWVMKALNNCLTLGQTLLDAKEVVNCLNNILNCIVFAMFILSWLLLTENATTKVLVVIASQLLAASFIFGDTCKTMFEGIIFAFIKHPFDVGDLCVIDETEMEVKQINIWTTTFLRLDTKRDALYPNSVLAAKSIINLEFKPDLNDTIELSLALSTKKACIDGLETEIKNYIDKSEKFEGSGHVMMKHIGNNIKIVVHFQHIMSTLDASHSQCRENKNKQRSQFLLQTKYYLEKLNIQTV